MALRSPACAVVVDGKDLSSVLDPRFMSLTLTSQRGDEADQLDLVITDHDDKLAIPPAGAIITLALGWRGEPLRGMGAFKADEIAWDDEPAKITVRARSADFTADLRIRRERSWRDTTLGDVVGQLAAGAGLTTRIAPDLAARPIKIIAQSRESDIAFLRRLGRDHDAVATIKAGSMIFGPIGAGQTPSGKPLPEITLTRKDGKATWKTASRDKYKGVTASYHEGGAARRHTTTAGEKDGSRRLKTVYASKAEADRAAAAEWTRVQRGAAEMTFALVEGRADIHPECKVRFEGYKRQVSDPTWLVTQVTHTFGDGGFTTSLQLENAP
ncbi:contractile injection system protein, VgrG/Pvc8 family [Caulobacter segnis]|uniref:Late control protein n=1 Tax=Caulobacter segnis TaxID=88688 RepID=A0A2W5XH22_9CAUL|nr:contractile injection system protein, VgrG/Pvc8 family [Caulobacter segnis]PZR37191.1 MAG: late control protein [Caulobacter segnis]